MPLHYFAAAHLFLAAALVLLIARPRSFVGFFYHPEMMAPVHLVTLGWISASILGALYMIAPMALRTRLAESRLDRWAFWSFALGASGIASHFWIDSYGGMLSSAPLVFFGFLVVGWRVVRALPGAPIALGVKMHITLAFVNLLAAAVLAVLVGANRLRPILPGYGLSNVYAHVHLAAVGWATMMVFGAAYRLLPMLLPAAVPPAWLSLVSALGLEAGTIALAAGLLVPAWTPLPGALLIIGAVVVFLAQVGWMRLHPRPPAQGLPRPDFGVLHVGQALVYLILTCTLGLTLLLLPDERSLRLAPVYGVAGLLGFLAQMVVGVASRLLPLYSWFRSYAERGPDRPPPPPYSAARPALAGLAFVLWTLAIPALALGLYREQPTLVATAAGALLAALTTGTVTSISQFRAVKQGTVTSAGRD